MWLYHFDSDSFLVLYRGYVRGFNGTLEGILEGTQSGHEGYSACLGGTFLII
jgi:hypothetical protein